MQIKDVHTRIVGGACPDLAPTNDWGAVGILIVSPIKTLCVLEWVAASRSYRVSPRLQLRQLNPYTEEQHGSSMRHRRPSERR
jgi:hypothetical protein